MKKRQRSLLLRSWMLIFLMAICCNVSMAGTWVQGGHSGGWVNPDQGFNGMFVEVVVDANSATGLSVVIAWYAFINGTPTWIVGFGPVVQEDGIQTANVTAFVYEGNDFPPLYDPVQTLEIPWGQMTLEFDGCDDAFFTWTSSVPGYGSGEMTLVRLTTIAESFCNPELGTDADDLDDHGNFWQTATEFVLKNLQTFQAKLSGDIDYEQDIDVFRFEVFKKSNIIVSTAGGADTTGDLYMLEANAEILVTSDDDSGDDSNFRIEEQLEPGIYTLHVKSPNLKITQEGRYVVTLIVTQV